MRTPWDAPRALRGGWIILLQSGSGLAFGREGSTSLRLKCENMAKVGPLLWLPPFWWLHGKQNSPIFCIVDENQAFPMGSPGYALPISGC